MSNEFMFRRIILKYIFDTFLDYPISQGRIDSDIFSLTRDTTPPFPEGGAVVHKYVSAHGRKTGIDSSILIPLYDMLLAEDFIKF